VAIGTTKGLFFVSDGTVDGPFLAGESVGAFAQLGDRFVVASTGPETGPTVRASDDGGVSWSKPKSVGLESPGSGANPAAIWQLHVDRRPAAAGAIWAGADSATLLRSEDGGETFEPLLSFQEHADRPSWNPGRCGLALHSIVTHPELADRLVVAISAAGVYRSDDGGKSWTARNLGIGPRAAADASPDAGPCVHKIAVDAVDPDVLWAQTRSGIYRTDDACERWEPVGHAGDRTGLPADFGFTVVAHPAEAGTAYLLPLESDVFRCTPQGRCRVYRTTDGGHAWEALSDGLPGTHAFLTVLRDAFDIASDPPHPLVFGSKSGHVFASQDSGDSWRLVTSYLPPILCVRVLD
jgi:photosystem II stability/assembly factor-like uncharacterized protein